MLKNIKGNKSDSIFYKFSLIAIFALLLRFSTLSSESLTFISINELLVKLLRLFVSSTVNICRTILRRYCRMARLTIKSSAVMTLMMIIFNWRNILRSPSLSCTRCIIHINSNLTSF
jgi:hypothetical protein